MKKTIYFLFFLTTAYSQTEHEKDDFYKFGPFDAPTYRDLKIALKEKNKVYRLELKNVSPEPKQLEKFGELTNILSLRFFNNQFKSWPEGLAKCKYLCFLASYLNPVTTFPPHLKNYTSLQFIDIQHSKIDSIPSAIAYLQNLRVLKIGNTEDTLYFPKTLKYLKNLKELHLENLIPDSNLHRIFKIKTLQTLVISGTPVKKIPASISALQNLDLLILDNNHLTSIPWEIGNLKNLRILRLANNRIEKLPDTLTELENLVLIDLRGNPISPEELEKWRALLPGCEIKF
ncbi:MAG: leucine-rich repeat domain-containing protein [Bacteroidia bacterium]|nr:leucine-rich repeat domain-containing protein [Bacteroidia bacterium]